MEERFAIAAIAWQVRSGDLPGIEKISEQRSWIMKVCRLATSSLFVVAVALISQAGQAQNREPVTVTGEAGEIPVTAQKREQRLQDVPVSVTVVDSNYLRQTNVNGLMDIGMKMPNLRLTSSPAVNLLYIRGVGSGSNVGFEQAVGTFVDGLYRGRSRSANAGIFDLERIEVLKGPQTTFFGNNVIAGALNITTRKPGETFSYNGDALYAPADGEYTVEGGADLPVSHALSLRLAGKAFGMNGYAYNKTTKEHVPHQRALALRASAKWEPTDWLRSDMRIDWGRQRNRGEPVTEGVGCPPDIAYGAPRSTCLKYLNSGQPIDSKFDYRLYNIPTHSDFE